jgi:hypothetical protein
LLALVSAVIGLWEAEMRDHKPYTPAAKTNVLETFKRQGWVPPSEQQEYQNKWQYYKSLYLKEPEPCKK